MSKFLSIIIPHYRETEKDIFPLLSSIAGQLGIDFSTIEIIVVNDGNGTGIIDQTFLSLFDISIRQISLDTNRGPGVARQVGLDVAEGEYVMFCDADDTLHSVGVLGALIQEAVINKPDIISSEWLEEIADPIGNRSYITHHIENTWMHGKLLKREFLQKNNIRFHDNLRVHEDSYFLSIAGALTENKRHIPVTTYVWKYRPDSITRRDNSIYTFASFPTFIEACCMSHTNVEGRIPKLMEYKIVQFVLYIYFSLQRPEWQIAEVLQFRDGSERMFEILMVPFWKYWDKADPRTIARIYNEEREKNFLGCIESEAMTHWVNRMKNKGES